MANILSAPKGDGSSVSSYTPGWRDWAAAKTQQAVEALGGSRGLGQHWGEGTRGILEANPITGPFFAASDTNEAIGGGRYKDAAKSAMGLLPLVGSEAGFGSKIAADAKYAPLPGAPKFIDGPVPGVVDTAERYAAENGIPLRRQDSYGVADPRRGKYIANAYEKMPHAPDDPKVKAAYSALSDETMAQWDAMMKSGADIDFIKPGAPDPYPGGPREALADLRANNHLHVFPTTEGFGSLSQITDNPLLKDTGIVHKGHPVLVNDAFRAVHDYFGHGMEGANFGARGEENAWRAHQRLFSPDALPAATSETRGQNSWVNFGPYGDANRANQRETIFADQKTGVMPAWTYRENGMPLSYRAGQAALAGGAAATAMLPGSAQKR